MKIPCSEPKWRSLPFHGVIPRTSVIPLGHITLPITLGTRDNFRTDNLSFEVADFEMAYHAIFTRQALTKFMVVCHYSYLVLKLPGPNSIITLCGDVRQSYDCEQESCMLAETLQESTKQDNIRLTAATL